MCPHKSYWRAGCDGYSFSQQRGCDYHLKMEWEFLLQDRNETRDETTGGSQSDESTTSVPLFSGVAILVGLEGGHDAGTKLMIKLG